ncbi:MAG: hypothetical protein RR859_09615, partial [Ruthenibacterium sp.]
VQRPRARGNPIVRLLWCTIGHFLLLGAVIGRSAIVGLQGGHCGTCCASFIRSKMEWKNRNNYGSFQKRALSMKTAICDDEKISD